jgi:hypothetical protein
VEDWQFGLTTRDRVPKPAFEVVRQKFATAPYFPLPHNAACVVVVANLQWAATLTACLQSLEQLNYPDYEVILVDDGSTDHSLRIAAQFPGIRLLRHEQNRGLSAARNTGIYAPRTGEIVCLHRFRLPRGLDWLHYLVGDLLDSRCAGIGGHNFFAPEDLATAACVTGCRPAAGPRDDQRSSRRSTSRVQHGVLQVGAARDRRIRSDLPQGGR